jgi:hypothetical protein
LFCALFAALLDLGIDLREGAIKGRIYVHEVGKTRD